MPDPYRKARSGEAWTPPSAQLHNDVIDTVVWGKQQRQSRKGGGVELAAPDPAVIKVRNASGSQLDRFAVVGLDVPTILPTDDADQFASRVLLDGKTPTSSHKGKFAVLLEPADVDQVVSAVVAGMTIVKLSVTSTSDTYADAEAGVTATLKTATEGGAQILWKESGTGTKWGIVRLPASVAAPAGKWGKVVGGWDGTTNTITLDPCSAAGTDNGEANLSVNVTLPTSTPYHTLYASLAAGDILLYKVVDNIALIDCQLPLIRSKNDKHAATVTSATTGKGGFAKVQVA